jgi:hypothetical protein
MASYQKALVNARGAEGTTFEQMCELAAMEHALKVSKVSKINCYFERSEKIIG